MKRGSVEVLETTMLFELLAGVLVAGILSWALFNFGEVSFTSEGYLTQDIQQIEQYIQSSPKDFRIDYPVFGITYDGEDIIEDEFCKLKIVETEGEVDYQC